MSDGISRREFLKLAGLGTVASAALAGAGTLSASAGIPAGLLEAPTLESSTASTIATTCSACAAGCGILVTRHSGDLMEIAGNPSHPLNQGVLCPRVEAMGLELSHPQRVSGPLKRTTSGAGFQPIDWETAVEVFARIWSKHRPTEIAFLVGLFPDHLYDLLGALSKGLGGFHLHRYSAQSRFDASVTLMDAAHQTFGIPKIPYFDVQHAELVFSFGAHFLEPWLLPLQYSGSASAVDGARRRRVVHFGPHPSALAGMVDEWVPVIPGSEALLAGALARLVLEYTSGVNPQMGNPFDLHQIAASCGVPVVEIQRLARLFASAARPISVPGSSLLGNMGGTTAARAVLALNVLVDNLGRPGGLYLLPDSFQYASIDRRPSTFAEINALVGRIKTGEIKALFVHGVDPVADLPRSLDFEQACANLESLISFAPIMDRTALLADYILPDHHPLESCGYQVVSSGVDRLTVSAIQPVVPPQLNTRATGDVLLAAVQSSGGDWVQALHYHDQESFLQSVCTGWMHQGGCSNPPDFEASWIQWLQQGGWWTEHPTLMPPVSVLSLSDRVGAQPSGLGGDGEYPLCLVPLLQTDAGDLERTAQIAEIHPQTAGEMGVKAGDTVLITSPFGELEALLRETPQITQSTLALLIDLRPKHISDDGGTIPLGLFGALENGSGDLAFMATSVKLNKVGNMPTLLL